MKAVLIQALVKLGIDLFGNKLRAGMTSGGAVLLSLLIALGVNPHLAQGLANVGVCIGVEAVKYHNEHGGQVQGEKSDDGAGNIGHGDGEGQPVGYHSGGDSPINSGRTVAPGARAIVAYESAHCACGVGATGAQALRRWPWVGPDPVPA